MTLHDLYRNGPDAIIDQGAAGAHNNMVVIRGITDAEVNESRGIIMTAAESMSDIRKAVAYEIVSLAPDVPAVLGLCEGDHCMTASAAVMPLADNGQCKYALVHCEDIVLSWDPAAIELPDEPEVPELPPGADRLRAMLEDDPER